MASSRVLRSRGASSGCQSDWCDRARASRIATFSGLPGLASPGWAGGARGPGPRLFPGRLVPPVQEPAAARRLAQALIDLETDLGEEFLNLGHRLQPIALPAGKADGASGLDRPVLDTLQRRRCGGRTLQQPAVVG